MQSPIWFHLPLKTIAGLQGDSEYNESERVAVQIAIYMRVEVVWLDRCFFLFVCWFVDNLCQYCATRHQVTHVHLASLIRELVDSVEPR